MAKTLKTTVKIHSHAAFCIKETLVRTKEEVSQKRTLTANQCNQINASKKRRRLQLGLEADRPRRRCRSPPQGRCSTMPGPGPGPGHAPASRPHAGPCQAVRPRPRDFCPPPPPAPNRLCVSVSPSLNQQEPYSVPLLGKKGCRVAAVDRCCSHAGEGT